MKTTLLTLALATAFAAEAATTNNLAYSANPSYCITDTLPQPHVVGIPDEKELVQVRTEASFRGGEKGWQAFVAQNLKPNTPVKHKAPVGNYTVVVQFIVDNDGKVVDIKPLTAHGFGMEEEVVRVLSKSPRWKPAVLENGVKVKAYRKQPISFVVSQGR